MLRKKNYKIILKYFKIENIVMYLLILILASTIIGGSFIYSKINDINSELVGLNMQFIKINNEQVELKNKINNNQNILMRLQSKFYRMGGENQEEDQ